VAAGTAAVPVRLAFSMPTAFAVGTPVEVEVDAEEHSNVVLIPSAALVREGDETAVFVTADNKAKRRPVTIGLEDNQHVEVRSGLTAGELVITHGHLGLPDGAAVVVEGGTKTAESADK
jgi:multidrug efflux pump subunit AcrA (membrane-fusion protein)